MGDDQNLHESIVNLFHHKSELRTAQMTFSIIFVILVKKSYAGKRKGV